MQAKQQELFVQRQSFVSIDPKTNRYRGYQIEMSKTKPVVLKTKWGRVEETKSGEWKLKKNSWLGEKEEQVSDEFDSEAVWEQICDQCRKRGHVDYAVLEL